MPATLPVNCFICDSPFKDAFGHEYSGISGDFNAPLGGTTFSASGNYGSGVYDPVTHGRYLEINICDNCLSDRISRVLVVEQQHTPRVYNYDRFKP